MIAIGIFGMVMVAIYSTWNTVLRGSKAGLSAAAEVQRSRIAIGALETALTGCEMFEANLPYYGFITDTTTDLAYLSLAARLPASFPGSGLFGDQTLRRVTFTVEPGQGAQNNLVMYQMPLLAITNADLQAIPITLARNVSLFGLEFWDVRQGEWGLEWLSTNQLPQMMRVSLVFGGSPDGLSAAGKETATRVVLLPAKAVPRLVQVPGAGGAPGRGGVRTGEGTPPPGPTDGGVVRPPAAPPPRAVRGGTR
jgi:hypothetical protein